MNHFQMVSLTSARLAFLISRFLFPLSGTRPSLSSDDTSTSRRRHCYHILNLSPSHVRTSLSQATPRYLICIRDFKATEHAQRISDAEIIRCLASS
jgi:hypothetical protein